ncbi:MAG: NUDIX hydrolase [Silicimonas sp.]|nr:NUDIX hydrolase [Silicimonas sp.]
MSRRVGEPVKPQISYKRRPGVYAILVRKHQVLLTHQAEPEPEFQLPGGGIDPGENPLPALHREVMEETGWRISNLRKLGVYRRYTYMPDYDLWAEKVCHIFLGRPVLKLGQPTEEGHSEIWTSPDAAVNLVASEGDRLFLSKTL